jgi:hypothetical protein
MSETIHFGSRGIANAAVATVAGLSERKLQQPHTMTFDGGAAPAGPAPLPFV